MATAIGVAIVLASGLATWCVALAFERYFERREQQAFLTQEFGPYLRKQLHGVPVQASITTTADARRERRSLPPARPLLLPLCSVAARADVG